MTDIDITAAVVRDIEAFRHANKNEELEEGLSLADWVNQRIAPAVKQAATMARHADAATQYEAWIEAAAIIVGRAEQVLRHQFQAECAHSWGEKPMMDSRCESCGLLLGDWSAAKERAELADELEAMDKEIEGREAGPQET